MKDFTIKSAKEALLNRKISAVELTKYYIDRINKYKEINAYITVTAEQAIESAKEADKKIAEGKDLPMLGIPIGMKDLFCTNGVLTTAGSRMLSNFIPTYESTISKRLKDAGAIMLGKTNMDEFAMGSSTLTSYYGPTWNCYRKKSAPDVKLVPGGSSGGSAAAVAADLAIAAIGSDTGGSIRQPSSLCGLVGIKPTYGMCSRYGMIAFGSSLDQAGPMCKTVDDAEIMLDVMAGFDEKDSTSRHAVQTPTPKKPFKIGIAKQYMEGIPEYGKHMLNEAIKWLEASDCQIVEIDLPMTKYALPVYYIIAPAEASSNLGRYDGVRFGYRSSNAENLSEMYINSRSEGFGEEVKRRILTGTFVLSSGYYDAYYNRALKIRKLIMEDFANNAFIKVDAVLSMTSPIPAFAPNDPVVNDPVAMYLCDVFTVTVNIAGLPGISVPAGVSDDGLPIGIQLIGNHWHEKTLFAIAKIIEDSANFQTKKKSLINVCADFD